MTTSVGPPTTQNLAGDIQAASNIVIRAADVPGFTGAAHNRRVDAELASCLNNDPVVNGSNYQFQADGEDFSNSTTPPRTAVLSSVFVAPTVEAAMASMSALKGPNVLPCINMMHKTSSRTPLSLSTIGDDVFAFKLEGDFTPRPTGIKFHLIGNNLFVRVGRSICHVNVEWSNGEPSNMATTLAMTMASRARAAIS